MLDIARSAAPKALAGVELRKPGNFIARESGQANLKHSIAPAALLLVSALSFFLFACAGDATRHSGDELLAMTPDQRLDQLSAGFVTMTHYLPGARTASDNFRDVIVQTYYAMLQKDGVVRAGAIYAMTLGRYPAVGNQGWHAKALALGTSDPAISSAVAARQFPAIEIGDSSPLARMEGAFQYALNAAAESADPVACDWLSADNSISAKGFDACTGLDTPIGAYYRNLRSIQQRQMAATQEAPRRLPQVRSEGQAKAIALSRHCAQVGVPNPPIAAGAVERLASEWQVLRTDGTLSNGYTNDETYIQALALALLRKSEAQAVTGGSAVTPYLPPLMYTVLVSAPCGAK